jgi:DNA modification methylase
MWPLDRLVPYERNARTHSPEQIAQIAASIQEFGFTNPILVDGSDGILAGHGRLAAAKDMGLADVPVIVLDHLSAEQHRAYILADNQLALNAGWDMELLRTELGDLQLADFDLSLIGFSDEELAELLPEVEELPPENADADAVPEAPEEPITKPGDVWLLGKHRVMCGDSTSLDDVERLMANAKADLCITSFPYGVGLDYGIYVDTFENCRQLLREVAPVIWSILRDGGFCITNFADIVSAREINKTPTPSEYPMALEYWPAFTDIGFLLHTRRVWAKPHARVSAPWTANSSRAACDWEHVWTWLKPGAHLNERRSPSFYGVIDSTKLEGVDVGKDTHPAAFPVGIAAAFVQIYSNNRESVFEPFCGTGTTVIACETAGRKCYAMEISPAYCDVIVKRWQRFTGKTATLEATGEPFPAEL